MTILSDTSLDFARAHFERFYDSDFFPKPLELEALWGEWANVKAYFAARNVEKLPAPQPRALPVPKTKGGYRIVHQLDVLSAIAYTALAHEISVAVEAARAPATIACSYRIAPSATSFFDAGSSYGIFAGRCAELAAENQYVLATDISDFYNSVYLHRLNGAIAAADAALVGKADDIEGILTRLNCKASQGIPVGPAASIVMAEALSADIDQFIQTHSLSLTHVRYVDDFRVFANEKEKLIRFLESFVLYLYEQHRLQLAPHKTELMDSADFVVRYLETPDQVERKELLGLVKELGDYPDRYSDDDAEKLTEEFLAEDKPMPPPPAPGADFFETVFAVYAAAEEEKRREIRREAFVRLFEKAASSLPVDVGLARRVLRRCKQLKLGDLAESVFTYFGNLIPLLPDVFWYLAAVTDDVFATSHLTHVRDLTRLPDVTLSRFATHWLSWYCAESKVFLNDRDISAFVYRDGAVEWQAKAACLTKNLAWIRARKGDLTSQGLFQRRAVLWASQALPLDERKAWLGTVRASTEDVVERWVIAWALGRP